MSGFFRIREGQIDAARKSAGGILASTPADHRAEFVSMLHPETTQEIFQAVLDEKATQPEELDDGRSTMSWSLAASVECCAYTRDDRQEHGALGLLHRETDDARAEVDVLPFEQSQV